MRIKPKKIKGLKLVIKRQEKFITQVSLAHRFLKMYEGNPEDFKLILSKEIVEHYKFNISWENPDYMLDSLDELTCDIVHGHRHFKIKSTGFFQVLHFSKTRHKHFKKLLKDFIHTKGPWAI
jgi:hypothetical protein